MNRIKTKIRGGLCAIIYYHALSTKSVEYDLAAVTLMSTDIDTILGNSGLAFNCWASVVEVTIGVWLLWRRLGPVAIAPILVMALSTLVQKKIGSAMSITRVNWTKAIQKRVGLTSNLLRSMKSIKLSGLVGTAADRIQRERVQELQLGKKHRWLVVWMNTVGG
jgi:ATP-binding cassette, subfamily C (CFTR/MRP), member 1